MTAAQALPSAPTAQRGALLAWAAFDFAVIPCFGLIVIFIFAPYFTTEVVGSPVRGQAIWGYTQAAAGLLIALLAPLLGAAADTMGARKPLLLRLAILAMGALAALVMAAPGEGATWPILVAVVLFSVSVEYMVVLHNAMLPSLVPSPVIGRWSGWSFGIGYAGTVGALLLVGSLLPASLMIVGQSLARGQAIGPLMAFWLALTIWPFFLFTPDDRASRPLLQAAREGLSALKGTVKEAAQYANIWRYFIARAIFYDGLLAVFLFAGVFAAGVFGWKAPQLALLGASQFLAAAIGAVFGGPIDDRIGSKRTLQISVSAVALGTLLLLATSLYADDVTRPPIELTMLAAAGFDTWVEQLYFLIAAATNLFVGPALASSRTMVVRISPADRIGQFFGLFSLLGRSTSFLAPLAIGLVTQATQSLHWGFASVLGFMVAGLLLLTAVREEPWRQPT